MFLKTNVQKISLFPIKFADFYNDSFSSIATSAENSSDSRETASAKSSRKTFAKKSNRRYKVR